eukprot:jgi/Ulvmu1/10333/UM061_0016.1
MSRNRRAYILNLTPHHIFQDTSVAGQALCMITMWPVVCCQYAMDMHVRPSWRPGLAGGPHHIGAHNATLALPALMHELCAVSTLAGGQHEVGADIALPQLLVIAVTEACTGTCATTDACNSEDAVFSNHHCSFVPGIDCNMYWNICASY